MKEKTTVETAQKGQATKNNTPTGKVKTLTDATERRKAREEQFRNFRINALKRRCARYGFDEAKTNEYVEKLKKQMDAPKEYNIMVIFAASDYNLLKEAVKEANIKYNILVCETSKARICYGHMSLCGDQTVLAKIREIAPTSAKIYPYAKKMESVIDEKPIKKEKKPTNNTPEKKAAANPKRTMHKAVKSTRYFHRVQKGKLKNLRELRKAAKTAKKSKSGTTVQLNSKKGSTGSKKASTNVKKAA